MTCYVALFDFHSQLKKTSIQLLKLCPAFTVNKISRALLERQMCLPHSINVQLPMLGFRNKTFGYGVGLVSYIAKESYERVLRKSNFGLYCMIS